MNDTERIEMLKELVTDWRSRKLSDGTAMLIVAQITHPQEPRQTMMKWAHEQLAQSEVRQEAQEWLAKRDEFPDAAAAGHRVAGAAGA